MTFKFVLKIFYKKLNLLNIKYWFFILFIQVLSLFGQENRNNSKELLINKTYEELYLNVNKLKDSNYQKAELYAKSYIQKAKNENNNLQITSGYYLMAFLNSNDVDKVINFLDQGIESSKKENGKVFPALLYMNKGGLLKEKGLLIEALDNYFLAEESAEKSNNFHLFYSAKHNIALIKRKLGYLKESKKLLKQCLNYEKNKKNKKKKDSISYFMSVYELINTYRYSKDLDSVSILNEKTLEICQYNEMKFLFKVNEAILKYHDGKYEDALEIFQKTLPDFYRKENRFSFEDYNLIDIHLYLSKTLRALGEFELAAKNYKKTDSLLQISNYKIPENVEVYKEIVDYYKSINDRENQLVYINKLITFDSVIDQDFKILNDKIKYDYDLPKLRKEKEELISSFKDSKNNYLKLSGVLFILVSLGFGLFVAQYVKRKQQLKKFNHFVELDKQKKKKKNIQIIDTKNSVLPERILEKIFQKLEEFEKTKSYTEVNITTNSLAKLFETNSKYISKAVQHLKGKTFIQYINDLRIDYAIVRIQNEKIFRKYTVKSMSKESGFNNSQTFSTCFHKKTGVYPSFFVKQIEKKQSSL